MMNNTVYENLVAFAEFKGIPKDNINIEIYRVMQRFKMETFKNTPVFKLNRDSKRILSISIALLNNPKIIILDEPTSGIKYNISFLRLVLGLDPLSRRKFWDIIKDLKQENKTILFTTQFLNEAEDYADRIGILSRGKLLAVGGIEYIKKKFGVGYSMVLQNTNGPNELQAQASEIASKVKNYIPKALGHSDTALNLIKYILPFEDISRFSPLFTELQKLRGLQV